MTSSSPLPASGTAGTPSCACAAPAPVAAPSENTRIRFVAPLARGWRALRSVDRAGLAIALISLGLLTFDPVQALESVVFVALASASALPFLVLSAATAAGVGA